MQTEKIQLIALAMLYLGEGTKWQKSRAPKLASSSPAIIRLYLDLIMNCYEIPIGKLRARVQHRADQNPEELLAFWSSVTKIAPEKFYRCYIGKRTVGKATTKTDYRGV